MSSPGESRAAGGAGVGGRAGATVAPERRAAVACAAVAALACAVQGAGILRGAAHWDEAIFLANLHAWMRGDALQPFQTAWVHLFRWLPAAGGELGQIRAGRGVLLAAWIASLALAFRLALRLGGRAAAWGAVAAAAALSANVAHAASFRVDGLMAPVFLAACLAALDPSPRRAAAAGALTGVLVALSLKGLLLVPVVAGIALVSHAGRPGATRAAAAAVAAFAATALGVLAAHASTLAPAPPVAGGPGGPGAFLANAGVRMLGSGILPRLDVLADTVRTDLPQWALAAAGVGVALSGRGAGGSASRAGGVASAGAPRVSTLALLAAPAALFLVYRNLWPYALVSLLPSVWVVSGVGWAAAMASDRRWARGAAWAALAWMAAAQIPAARALGGDAGALQRRTLEMARALFPEPVPYVARVGVIATFPRPLFNMTTFGMETYRDAGEPAVARYIEQVRPPLLILDTPTLAVFGDSLEAGPEARPALLAEDAERVRETYARYWGPVYLAGRRWDALVAGEERTFTVHVPGPFTLLAGAPVEVDGTALAPGASVELAAGVHVVASRVPQEDVALLWGRNLRAPPADAPPAGPFYRGF